MKIKNLHIETSTTLKAVILGIIALYSNISTTNAQNTCVALGGNWNNSGTWSSCGGGIPQDGDLVRIPDNVSVTVNASNQYGADGSAPFIHLYVGDDDGDGDGGHISFDGKLNLREGSTFIVYDNSFTTDDAPGSSEKIRWWTSSGNPAGTLSGSATSFTGPATVVDGSVNSGINDPLPVEFGFFYAEKEQKSTILHWTTLIEENNDYFTIERSENGLHGWEEIGTIGGAGNSSTVINYSFTDYFPLSGISYYRIKQTDYDGQFAYSTIVTCTQNNTSSVFPNPVSGTLNITGDELEISNIRVYNNLGEEIAVHNKISSVSNQHKRLNLEGISSGIYFISTSSTRHTIHIQ